MSPVPILNTPSRALGLQAPQSVAGVVPEGPYFQAYLVPTVEPLQDRLAGAQLASA